MPKQRTGKLKRDLPTNLWGADIVLPKGTKVELPNKINSMWAVSSVDLLIKLTGNAHDPKYRYAWVTDTEAEETS
jgi:hypothetical protein